MGWNIQGLIRDKDQLDKVREAWVTQSSKRVILDLTCNCSTLDMEVEQIKDTLTDLFNKYSKIMQVTSYLKKWWTKDSEQAHKV